MRKLLLIVSFLILACGSILAQSKTITGTVIGDDGLPVLGASVVVKGTTIGTTTDLDGKYELNVPANAEVLEFRFIGMQNKEMQIGNSSVVNATLESDAQLVDEIIVTAYGSTRREAKTGAITTVKADEIADVPASSVDKMLSGKMAGVMITAQSGQPGASTSMRIRGTSSINAGNNPLYVIDGIAVMSGDYSDFGNTSNALTSLNPDDVESITVLKDAAATSVYGSRAANGVVLITTKSGREGKSVVTARAKIGVSQLANDNDYGVMTGHELLEYQRQAAINAGHDPDDPTDTYYTPYSLVEGQLTNWVDHLSRTGKMQDYEISATGGNGKTNYYTSINFQNNEGVFYGIDFKKVTARVNADHEINKYFKSGARVSLGYSVMNDVPMQSLYYSNPIFAGMTIMPWVKPYTEDGLHNVDIPSNSDTNPRATADYDEQIDKQYRINGNMYLQVQPIEGLVIKTTNAAELMFTDGRRYWDVYTNQGEATLQSTRSRYALYTTSNTITYDKTILDKNQIHVLVGQEATRDEGDQLYLSSKKVDPNIPYPSTSTQADDAGDYYIATETLMSFFGMADYNYDSRYYLQASLRRDGSSKFGKDKKWGTFWSVGASWNAHNEAFLSNVDWIDFLKIRGSYGINGNNGISNYRHYGVYTTSAYNGVTGMRSSRPSNDKLSWEVNKGLNFGFDFSFFRNYTINFDIYKRKTEDMLLNKPVSRTSGFSSELMNIGKLENKGIEIQASANIINRNKWKWSVNGNISFNKTKITDLAGEKEMAYSSDSRLRHTVGKSMFTFYVRDYYGVNPTNGEALFVAEDGSLTSDYNQARYIYAGSPEPKYTGGISTDLSWNGISLSAQLEFKGGNKVMIVENRYLQSDGNQMSMNQAKSALNYWKKPGDTGCNPKPVAGNSSNSYSYSTDRFIENGDYLRVKDVTLAYTLPRSIIEKASLSNVRFYVSGLNVYTFHDVNFWDPERGVDGMGTGIYPMTKTFVVGVDLSF